MSERVTSLMTSQMMLSNLESSATALNRTAEEVSTGQRINQPSDDPYGTGLTLQLQGQASALGSYSTNVDDATGWAQTTSTALGNIDDVVQRVRELVVGAANGTNSSSDLQDDAEEVSQLIDTVKQDAGAQYNGQYVFSGTATATAPYASGTSDSYQGNGQTVKRQIGPGTTVTVSTSISGLFGNGQAAGDGGLLDTLRTIQQDLASGNSSALGGSDLTALDANLGTLGALQVDNGVTQQRLSQASSQITDLQATNTTLLGQTRGVDIAQAMTTYTTQQAAYTAALQTTASLLQKDSLMNFLSS